MNVYYKDNDIQSQIEMKIKLLIQYNFIFSIYFFIFITFIQYVPFSQSFFKAIFDAFYIFLIYVRF